MRFFAYCVRLLKAAADRWPAEHVVYLADGVLLLVPPLKRAGDV